MDFLKTQETAQSQQKDQRRSLLLLVLLFLCILAFNLLTPKLSDDFSYGCEVRSAQGIADLFRQEAHQYQTWNGRSVVHLLLRLSLYLPLPVFKICNSLMFVVLLLLMERNIPGGKRHDPVNLVLVFLGVWFGAVDFGQTILWQTGACNYLWGSVIILGFMTLVRKTFEKGPETAAGRYRWLGYCLFGILAGWCNENTSGGALLFVLILLVVYFRRYGVLHASLVSAAAGNLTGLLIMVLAPGNAVRASLSQPENFDGILKYAARFQKVTLVLRDEFRLPILGLTAAGVLLALLLKGDRDALKRAVQWPLIYLFLWAATSYAMILARPSEPRAFFGAGIFLLLALLNAVLECVQAERQQHKTLIARLIVGTGLIFGSLAFLVSYLDCGTNLGRIYRDYAERVRYIENCRDQGILDVTVAQVHPDFLENNPYTAVGGMEPQEDPEFWINGMYEQYFGVEAVRAVPYDDWKQLQEEGSIPAAE